MALVMIPDRLTRNNEIGRRETLRAFGVMGALVAGGAGISAANTNSEDDESTTRTIEWDNRRGVSNAHAGCSTEYACWQWMLAAGGSPAVESVGDLTVTFTDGSTASASPTPGVGGVYRFEVCEPDVSQVRSASVELVGGGPNAQLTITDVTCISDDTTHWSVNFGAGEVPDPPRYYPDDLMAALGDSSSGVISNPDTNRQQSGGQLRDVVITDNALAFDDDEAPSEVSVTFTLDDEAPERDLHLAVYRMPGPFDPDRVEDHEYYDSVTQSASGGDTGSLSLSLPT